jgi:stage IV sporulation protein FB
MALDRRDRFGRRSLLEKVAPVILAEPPRTQYDLNFQILGFPVRIHPLFWLIAFVLGFHGAPDGMVIAIWMLVVTVSILVHELGHALAIRRFGRPAHIVLYGMGGLAIEGEGSGYSDSWSSYSSSSFGRRSRTPTEQILISIAGPAAGFILAGLVILGVFALGGSVTFFITDYYIPWWQISMRGLLADKPHLHLLIDFLLQVNILWGILNLLPIFPLDGGQIAQQVFVVSDPWGGMVKALWLSVLVAGAMAVLCAIGLKSMLMALMFGSLAVSNYMTLQQLRGGGGGGPW